MFPINPIHKFYTQVYKNDLEILSRIIVSSLLHMCAIYTVLKGHRAITNGYGKAGFVLTT